MIIHHLRSATDRAKPKYSEKNNLSKCHFFHHPYYTDRIEIEPGLWHWQADDPCLKHGTVSESQEICWLLIWMYGEQSSTVDKRHPVLRCNYKYSCVDRYNKQEFYWPNHSVAKALLFIAYRNKKVFSTLTAVSFSSTMKCVAWGHIWAICTI
jgi:hypothetical protein